MNTKKYVLASLTAGLAAWAIDSITHGMILADAYKHLQPGMMGSQEQMMKWIWLSPVAYFGLTFALGWFFIRGYENRGAKEGLLFGLMAGLLIEVPRFCAMVMYYLQPAILDVVPLITGLIKFIFIGLIFTAIYKPLPNKL